MAICVADCNWYTAISIINKKVKVVILIENTVIQHIEKYFKHMNCVTIHSDLFIYFQTLKKTRTYIHLMFETKVRSRSGATSNLQLENGEK